MLVARWSCSLASEQVGYSDDDDEDDDNDDNDDNDDDDGGNNIQLRLLP
jgi:hypothetical protein